MWSLGVAQLPSLVQLAAHDLRCQTPLVNMCTWVAAISMCHWMVLHGAPEGGSDEARHAIAKPALR
eukprot:1641423-Pyramimonas_sp.AAC.1